MSCLISTFDPACDASNVVGGLFGKLYIAKREDIATAPVVSNVVTAMTMVGAAVFYEFVFVPQKGSQDEEATRSESDAMFYTANLKGTLSANTAEARDFVEGLADCTCGLVWVYKDGKGVQYITGLREEGAITGVGLGDNAKISAASFKTGDAMTSANTSEVTFTSLCTKLALRTTVNMTTLV